MYYYTTRRNGAARKPAVKRAQVATVLGAEVMWAVAAYADRVNGGYVRDARRNDQGEIECERNRDIIKSEIVAGLPNVNEADYELGREARKWLRGQMITKILRAQPLNDFENSLKQALDIEEFSNFEHGLAAAIVASQIQAYRKGVARDQLMENIDRTPLAPVGDKVSVTGSVTNAVYSQNYGVFFITAQTECNRLMFFAFRKSLDTGTKIQIRGTVKSHRPDSTQLNRVSVV